MFANLVNDGSWVEATIERAMPNRDPIPKPDIRRTLIPLGPVVVFAASNFPLAFSVAGGDTASALAAGNPVIVKAHRSHPGTSALIASAIVNAAKKTGMPDGIFSLLHGEGSIVGQGLIKHSKVKAGAFTGSQKAGKILCIVSSIKSSMVILLSIGSNFLGICNIYLWFMDTKNTAPNELCVIGDNSL